MLFFFLSLNLSFLCCFYFLEYQNWYKAIEIGMNTEMFILRPELFPEWRRWILGGELSVVLLYNEAKLHVCLRKKKLKKF